MTSAATGLVHLLPAQPLPFPWVFPCPRCHQGIYDGGIPRKAECACGRTWLRDEKGEIREIQQKVHIRRVVDLFENVVQTPGEGCPELQSLTLGVFDASVPTTFKSNREVDYGKLREELWMPWFLRRQRVLGIGDLFEISDVRFKVMAALPFYGRVVQSTQLICYESLKMTPLIELTIGILEPAEVNLESSSLGPYLRGFPRHIHLRTLHSDQYLYINSHEFVVLTCEPSSGVIEQSTSMTLNGNSMGPAYYINLRPEPETLAAAQGADLRRGLVQPFFQGWRRPVPFRTNFTIAGVHFQTLGATSPFCYVTPFTEIQISEQGSSMEDLMELLRKQQLSAGTNLPTRELTTLPPDPESRDCIICQESYQPKDIIKTLPCCKAYLVHFFHKNCIDDWLGRSSECPLCKSDVNQSE